MNDVTERDQFLLQAFDTLLKNSSDMIFVKDRNLNYIAASDAFVKVAGLNSWKEAVGKSDYDLFDEELAAQYVKRDRCIMESGVPSVNLVEPLPDQHGKKSYSSTSKYLIRDEDGNVIGLYGIGRDVTAEIVLEEEREFRQLSNIMFDGVLEADLTEDCLLRVEGSIWEDRCGELMTKPFSQVMEAVASQFIHLDYGDDFRKLYDRERLTAAFDRGENGFSHVTYYRCGTDQYRWAELRTRIYHSKISGTLRISVFLKDKDEEFRRNEQLRRRAERDSLTGLLNRESVMERIRSCISGDGKDKQHALLFIDLDCFKQINDNLGHAYGDKVLKGIAQKIGGMFREDDFVGRIGGDEFLVFIKNVHSQKDVEERAARIFGDAPLFQMEEDISVSVTCSVGVSMYHGDGERLERLYMEADEAMYKAKNKGKNQILFSDETRCR